jgi:hypothetical protein
MLRMASKAANMKVANMKIRSGLNPHSSSRMFGHRQNPNEDAAVAGLVIAAAAGVTVVGAVAVVGLGVGIGIGVRFFGEKNKKDKKESHPKRDNSVEPAPQAATPQAKKF